MRVGRVSLVCEYVVDLDNPEMVAEARMAVLEDIGNASREELLFMFKFTEDPALTAGDIPSWLVEMCLPQGALYTEVKQCADS